eukprot:TRINITY_DN2087_c0_g1_i1.p1 TRINITY_DN2087_c0_g1~~TRINITY_DN2087_c0_g1_i1.p1  ORF type:complete len:115 (-),score=16.85 TRINITY_DN2087_c0_g1_i1:205-549(-)
MDINPILEYLKYIILPWLADAADTAGEDSFSFVVERGDDHGGNLVYHSYEDIAKDFEQLNLHPGDLKPSVAREINKLLQPVRDHFAYWRRQKNYLEKSRKIVTKMELRKRKQNT